MILGVSRRVVPKFNITSRTCATAVESEYTETPQYPPILDLSNPKKLERKKEAYYEEIKKVKTVEEKQIKLNMPRYWGFKCYMLEEDRIPYNNLTLTQHVTRTHLIQKNSLPSFYDSINVEDTVGGLKNEIEDAILIEHEGYRKSHEIKNIDVDKQNLENMLSKNIVQQINRIILNNLNSSHPHLLELNLDFEPRIESFWYAGGMNPPENIKRYRRSQIWNTVPENEPTDRAMQYLGSPSLTLRSEVPLAPIIPPSEASNPSLEVPLFQFDPRTVGTYCVQNRRLTNIPGFWPDETHQFGVISYHNRGHFHLRNYKDPSHQQDALNRQGILAGFGWLNAQANYQGFTTFNDLTYPLTTQCVITNGQLWSFYVYQLNTLLVHSKHAKENLKRNVCWGLNPLKLYEEVKDGKVLGLNDEVLKILLKFYANRPKMPEGVENLRPYLGEKEKTISDYEDPDKRAWLEREYKFLMSNRPMFALPYEIYHWEKIYKIDHDTRPMDKKKRPFDIKVNPWKRTYDDRLPKYIPRKLRPDLPRHKGRYAKEYFP